MLQANRDGEVHMAYRTLGFAAIGFMPHHSRVELCQRALDTAPELQNGDTSAARRVVSVLARGILPSQELCLKARGQVDQLRQAHAQGERESDPASPRLRQ